MPEYHYRFTGEVAERFLDPEIREVQPGQRVVTSRPVEHARLKRIAPPPPKTRKPKQPTA